MASSRFPEAIRHAIRSMTAVNRSVLYSRAMQSRSPSRAVIIVRSKSAVCSFELDRLGSESVQTQPRAGDAQRERGQAMLVEALGFLVGEHHLEQRRTARIGISLEPIDEQAEGKVLVFQAVGDGPANSAQEFVEGRVAREVYPASAPC